MVESNPPEISPSRWPVLLAGFAIVIIIAAAVIPLRSEHQKTKPTSQPSAEEPTKKLQKGSEKSRLDQFWESTVPLEISECQLIDWETRIHVFTSDALRISRTVAKEAER